MTSNIQRVDLHSNFPNVRHCERQFDSFLRPPMKTAPAAQRQASKRNLTSQLTCTHVGSDAINRPGSMFPGSRPVVCHFTRGTVLGRDSPEGSGTVLGCRDVMSRDVSAAEEWGMEK